MEREIVEKLVGDWSIILYPLFQDERKDGARACGGRERS